MNNYSRFIKIIYLTGDLLCINLAFWAGYLIKFLTIRDIFGDRYFTLWIVFNFAWIISAYFLRTYDNERVTSFDRIMSNLIRQFILHTLLVALFWVMRKAFYYSREQLLWTYLILYVLVTTWRVLLIWVLTNYRKKGYNYRRIIVLGAGILSNEFLNIIHRNKNYGYKVLGVFDDNNQEHELYKGSVEASMKYSIENKVDDIYCSVPDLKTDQIQKLSVFADNQVIRLHMIPDVRGFVNKRLNMQFFEHLPVLTFRKLPLDDAFTRFLKRAFDVFFSLIVIICIMSWLYPLMAILIKLSSKGPVLFKQMRSGLNNEEFVCWKFRTMKVNEDSDSKQATKGDSRITKIGSFLRKSSLDEFPQFFNVLRGTMSIVGPRPHMLKHTEQYKAIIDKYMVRHFVKPGITGLAQIKGFRGETKDPKMMENRIRLDMLYVESYTFLLDVWIVVRTVVNVFKKEENAF